MSKITGDAMRVIWLKNESGNSQYVPVVPWENTPIMERLAWEAVAANAAPPVAQQVPRIIHEAFWKKYYQWADGLEAVLKSEQVADLDIQIRLNDEYAAACTRLEKWMMDYSTLSLGVYEECDHIKISQQVAIPIKRMV